jgi:hypothetical protein
MRERTSYVLPDFSHLEIFFIWRMLGISGEDHRTRKWRVSAGEIVCLYAAWGKPAQMPFKIYSDRPGHGAQS